MDNIAFQKIIFKFIVFIVLSFIILVFDFFNLLALPKRFFSYVTQPVQIGVYSAYQSVEDNFAFLSFWKNGYKENTFLKQRNLELTVEAAKVKQLTEENESLKKQFAVSLNKSNILLPARVISYSRYLILNKGSQDGVKKDMVVVLGGVLVGKIKAVDGYMSTVMLPSDPDSKIVVLTTKNRAKGLLLGAFGEGLLLDQVVQSEKIEPEETIETGGSDGFPAGLLVARIVSINDSKVSVFQSAVAHNLLEYEKLTNVFIKVK